MVRTKNIFLFLLLFYFSQQNLLAQNQNKIIDSLLSVLETAKEDTSKLKVMNNLGNRYMRMAKYDETMKYANDVITLANKIINSDENGAVGTKKIAKREFGNAYNNIAFIHTNKGNYSEALKNINLSLKLMEEIGDKNGIANSYNSIGNVYRNQGKFAEALTNYSAAVKLYEETGNKSGMATSISNTGSVHVAMGNYDESLKMYLASLKIREEIGEKSRLTENYSGIANVYRARGNYIGALKYYSEGLKISLETGNKVSSSNYYMNIGTLHAIQGNYPEALRNILASLKIKEEIGDRRGVSNCYNNLGSIYKEHENYPEALKNYFNALKIEEEIGAKSDIAFTNDMIGSVYVKQGKYPEALKNHLSALKIREESGSKKGLATSYSWLGEYYEMSGNYDEALNYYQRSLKIKEEIGDEGSFDVSYLEIGYTLLKQAPLQKTPADKFKKYNEALQNFNKCLPVAKENGEWLTIKETYEGLIDAYKGIKDFQKALEYSSLYVALKDSVLGNESTRKLEQQRTQYEVEKAVAEEKIQKEKALTDQQIKNEKIIADENTRHQLVLAEEQVKKEKALEIAKLKYDFALATAKTEEEKILAAQQFENEVKLAEENAKHQQALAAEKASQQIKDAEAKTLLEKEKAEKNRKSELYITLLSILGLVSIFVIILIRQRNIKRRAVDKAETGHKMAELELQSLRAQLNPHFMFNSLNAIQDLILKEDNDRSHLYLSRFSKLLRMLLDNANQPFVSVKQEMEFLELYLSLENLRIPDLKFSIEKDPMVNMEERMVPNMMLQPYIENAIWHGLSNKKGDRKLQIRIHENGSATEFEIEDNGVGRKKAAEIKSLYRKGHTSKGMELLSKRFNLLSKEYGAAIQTTVTDLENNGDATGTLVKIDVPFSISDQARQFAHDTNHHN